MGFRKRWLAAAALLAAATVGAYLYFRAAPAPGTAPSSGAVPAPSAAPAAPGTIAVGTYNIQSFGKTKLARPGTMSVLADIGALYDVLALQEIGSNSSSASDETSDEVLSAYAALVDEAAGTGSYAYARSGQLGVLYRRDRLVLEDWAVYSGPEQFAYPPLMAEFRTLGAPLDFVLVVVHVRPSAAETEIPALARVMEQAALRFGEPDVACVGDFNADGSYYDEGEGLLLAGFPPERYISVVPNDADTTVSDASLAYDRIMLTAAMGEDYSGRWETIRPGSRWDLSGCEGPGTRAGTEAALSDHYPLQLVFFTGKDSD